MNTRFIALWIKKMNLLINAVLLKNINMQPHDISLHPDRVKKPVSIEPFGAIAGGVGMNANKNCILYTFSPANGVYSLDTDI